MEREKYVILAAAFDPIEIQTNLAPESNYQHLSFVKYFIAGGKKNDQNGS